MKILLTALSLVSSVVRAESPIVEAAEPPATAAPWKLEPPKVDGYIQAHYRYALHTGEDGVRDPNNFRVQRVRLGVEGFVTPWASYDIELDPRAPELSSVLRDAYVALHVLPRHEIRFGQQKTQFGYENRESSAELYAVNRTEVSDNLSRGQNLRDIGIGIVGNIKLGKGLRLEDAITVVNGAGMNVQDDSNSMKNVWGRIGLRYKWDEALVRLGVSGGYGDYRDPGDPALNEPAFRVKLQRAGADFQLDTAAAFVSAEYVYGITHTRAEGDFDESGWYVNLVGKTAWEMGPIVRFDTMNGEEFQRFTLGAYYGDAEAPFRVLLNYELRLRKDEQRGDDKVYLWTQARF